MISKKLSLRRFPKSKIIKADISKMKYSIKINQDHEKR